MKTVIGIKTERGWEHLFFNPTEHIHRFMAEVIDSRDNWKLTGTRSLNEKEFFTRKFHARVDELERTINAYDTLMSDQFVTEDTRTLVGHSLLDAIYSNTSIVLGMVRRSEKKGYNVDYRYAEKLIDEFDERRDY